MPQSPISFKSLFSSLAVSLLINGAASYMFLLNFHAQKLSNVAKTSSLNIILIDTIKSDKKLNNSAKKHTLSSSKLQNHKNKENKKSQYQAVDFHKKQIIKKKKIITLNTKPKTKKHITLAKKKIKHTKKIFVHKKAASNYRDAKNARHKLKFGQVIEISSSNTKAKFEFNQNKPKKTKSKTGITVKKTVGYFQINVSKKNYSDIFLWISKHKFYPLEALYKEEEGVVGLIFTINSSGFITKINIKKPSKYDVLNMAAIKIVHSSSPIPKNCLGSINQFPAKATVNIVFNIE